jgi:diguanylate cyclase (GGDEF)-like protein
MISLKKYINSCQKEIPETSVVTEASEPEGLLAAYQAALYAIGINGQRAVPALGNMIQASLTLISNTLKESPTDDAIREARRMVDEQLELWADKAQQHHKDSEHTLQELLFLVAKAAESTGMRDEKYGREIGQLSDKLRAVAGLDSLPLMRRSVIESASALTSCVTRMADEGRESVRKLSTEIAEYRTRLHATERLALTDPLTCLYNRRGFEEQLEMRIGTRQQFSLLVTDLNGFKAANDRYGHVVGDEILRQFARELNAQFSAEDTVARWGGDEFVAIISGTQKEAAVRADRVRHWVLGEYKITVENHEISVIVDAAVGTVAWDGAESGLELFARADKEMYRCKEVAGELARA